MIVEIGNWTVPLAVTVIVFAFAVGSVRAKVPDYLRTANRIFNTLIVAAAALASLCIWLVWTMVSQ
ncbi:hypothetical protein BAE36_24995 [Rhizobium leguminosarum bv. trifolii]|uniref:Transmembrane protein n=1 Tax=Rhizobium leguminosarum bv. trifolii TaxID=386 RepID=A0A1B8R6S0_RHILT|nr:MULTISPECIES: hypothetical protein [Rhizobium]UIY25860.1 hypothetical protein LZK76_10710 [Rhizobium leguminosarum]AOO92642.1 hypothetical protein [Rhizobium leguminosarum bv. trifolii]OBY04470.1 hypothetical protein BAE36_24995 [Rhizobium leguminosarum bv. trifolii]TBB28150.1 hypothetical protein ELH48_13785 [Rhizobium ruizarguesonis]TBB49767.1 hypothetical protein ELH46_13780 [Rhizobium ruizarguesonis]